MLLRYSAVPNQIHRWLTCIEQAGVDFVLLERRNEISPRIGQSIAAEPNGSRVRLRLILQLLLTCQQILDQLGILEEWKKHSASRPSFE
jgi:hypothetical protein